MMGDSDDENKQYDITSFLFGNIDESGQLEGDEFLDNETKRHLSSLSKFGLDSVINEIVADEDVTPKEEHRIDLNGDFDELDYSERKSPSAIDYSDINECITEEIVTETRIKDESMSDYDADDEGLGGNIDNNLMPPPPVPLIKHENETDAEAERRRLETPLAAMLPSKYSGVDVRELFPDFRVDKVPAKDKT